jgi:hypothetical protein
VQLLQREFEERPKKPAERDCTASRRTTAILRPTKVVGDSQRRVGKNEMVRKYGTYVIAET